MRIEYRNNNRSYVRNQVRQFSSQIGFAREKITKILLVLDELLDNVSKYARGMAIVTCENTEIINLNPGIRVSVKDFGDGISKDIDILNFQNYDNSDELRGFHKILRAIDDFQINTVSYLQDPLNSGTEFIFTMLKTSSISKSKENTIQNQTKKSHFLSTKKSSPIHMDPLKKIIIHESDHLIKFHYQSSLYKKLIRNKIREFCIKHNIKRSSRKSILLAYDEVISLIDGNSHDTIEITVRPWNVERIIGMELEFLDQEYNIFSESETEIMEKEKLKTVLKKIESLADDFSNISLSSPNQLNGSKIVFKKYATPQRINEKTISDLKEFAWLCVSKSNPVRGETYNGDAYFIDETDRFITFAVIDGVGHGKSASKASQEALTVLKYHHQEDLPTIIKKIHLKLDHTPGCQMILARIDKYYNTMNYITIGNLFMYLVRGNQISYLDSKEGTLGRIHPTIEISEIVFDSTTFIISHTDGISSNWTECISNLELKSITHYELLNTLFDNYQRESDDSTLLIIQNKEYS